MGGNVELELVPLVDKPSLFEKCIELLNEEWPRSQMARQVSLERTLNRTPPMAYVLIGQGDRLLGHARLSPLNLDRESCWVESVVVWREMRGRGLGRELMRGVELEARRHGFAKICLSTTDKLSFYLNCSYQQCDPIVNCGSHGHLFDQRPRLARFLDGGRSPKNVQIGEETDKDGRKYTQKEERSKKEEKDLIPAPPPPLPTPNLLTDRVNEKKFMFKML